MPKFNSGDIILTSSNYFKKILAVTETGYDVSFRVDSLNDPYLNMKGEEVALEDIEMFDQMHRLYTEDELTVKTFEEAIQVISAYYNLNPNSIKIISPVDGTKLGLE